MNLSGWQLQPTDVIYFNAPSLGWVNKQLEVVSTKFRQIQTGDNQTGYMVEVAVQETDQSVYEWSDLEELTPYDVPVISGSSATYTVAPPTSLTATGGLTAALVSPDGTVTPRIEVSWTEPADTYVTTNGGSIEIQMALARFGRVARAF